jgi:pyruvate,water dikinase
LARLVAAGHPVPAGFALAHDADPAEPATLSALRSGLVELGEVALAVRSSAIGEDGADAAFAGIYESVLDVRGEAGVLAAIAQVRASGSSARARLPARAPPRPRWASWCNGFCNPKQPECCSPPIR